MAASRSRRSAASQAQTSPQTAGSQSAKETKGSKSATASKRGSAKVKTEPGEAVVLPPSSSAGRSYAHAKQEVVQKEELIDIKTEEDGDLDGIKGSVTGNKKRKRSIEDDDGKKEVEGAPHNMSNIPSEPEEIEENDAELEDDSDTQKPKTSTKKPKAPTPAQSAAKAAKDIKDAERAVLQLATVKAKLAEEAVKREKTIESGKKTKGETYGLCEGQTPYPRWSRPTAEECQEVYDILLKAHPDVRPQPETIPPPSEFVAGCGEVRSILDALVRTRLSASTTGRNSNAAYQGMVKRYGLAKSGVGKGSVDYNAVRLAPVQDLFYAIKVGGLAVSKGADIKAMLELVYEENQARRKELLAAKPGTKQGNSKQRAAEIKLAEEENLSLDHCYTLPTYEAIYKFMTYPGIGVKTAACVAMFCMQRPSFAVDTHVFRLAKWLGWVPPPEEKIKGEKNVDRDTTFSHLEVRVPDHLKYMLHQLFLKHGKTCPRCRGITGEGSANWNKGCVMEHLVQRTGAKKGGMDSPAKSPGVVRKGNKKQKIEADESGEDAVEEDEEVLDEEEDDEDDDDESMPDLHDDDEEDGDENSSDDDDDDDDEEEEEEMITPIKKKTSQSKKNTPVKKATTASSTRRSRRTL